MTTDNFCFYLQNRQIQTSQTGGQRDTSPLSIPWYERSIQNFLKNDKRFINFNLNSPTTKKESIGHY
jgi:hypothetical protein